MHDTRGQDAQNSGKERHIHHATERKDNQDTREKTEIQEPTEGKREKTLNIAEEKVTQDTQAQSKGSGTMDALSGTPDYHSNTKKPVKVMLILAIAFLVVFTSFQALQNLQSSLNQQQGLGMTSLACIYGMIFVVSFFTPAIIYNVGVKTTILLAWFGHVMYVASNFYPTWGILVPGSLLLGAVSCPLWTSLNTYLSSLARVSVEQDLVKVPKKITTVHAAFSNLNGLFHAIFSASQLAGNLVSSTILYQSSNKGPEATSVGATSVGVAVVTECGAAYCPHAGEGRHLTPPEPYIVYIMLGVFLALDAAGICITWCCVPSLEQPRYTGREILRKLRSYWLAFSQPKLWLMVPLFASRGIIFSLHIGLFTEAYVSCALGIRMVGYVMAVWGLSTMLSSGLLGYAARYTGRRFLFGFAFVVDTAILLVFLLWHPHAGSLPVFFSLSAVMGLVDGIWSVQCNALIVILFPAIVDSAFSVSSTWHSLFMSASFLLAKFLCPKERLFTAFALLVTGAVGYVAMEVVHWWSLKSFDRDDHQYMLVNTAGDRDEGEGEEEERGVQETEFKDENAKEVNGDAGGGLDVSGELEDRQ